MARVSSKSYKTRTTPYDVAEHLRTPEEMVAYLDAWLEEAPDDVSGIAKTLARLPSAEEHVMPNVIWRTQPTCQRSLNQTANGWRIRWALRTFAQVRQSHIALARRHGFL